MFTWKTDKCNDDYLPNSPARALRLANGKLALVAAHYTNGFLIGRNFAELKPDCAIQSGGTEANSPDAMDTRWWVQAVWPLPSERTFALVSHEYLGGRFPGRCDITTGPKPYCWYSYIGKAEAANRDLKFRLLPREQRVAAAPPFKYDPRAPSREGFFTTSNIVADGQWVYFASWMDMPDNQHGNCLFRAPVTAVEGTWLALHDGEFTQPFPDPYRSSYEILKAAKCDIIGKNVFRGPIRSMVKLVKENMWAAVFQSTWPPDNLSAPKSGVYVSFSPDLRSWSAPALVFAARQPWGRKDCDDFFEYPSLIDHASRTPAFDTAGDEMYLYLTRFNFKSCRKGLDRDLVRIRIKVEGH